MKQQSPVLFFVAGTAFGSLAAFFLDPVRGTYRQSLVVDKFIRFKNSSTKYSGRLARHLKNKSVGIKSKTKTLSSDEKGIPDEVLMARVRSKFGRIVSHPKSVFVLAHDGVVTLCGPILEKEVRELIKCVKKVRGVNQVVNDLTVHKTNKGISALQGDGPAYLRD